jgi:hypothetical protein
MIQISTLISKSIKDRFSLFVGLTLSLVAGGCSKKENPFVLYNSQTNDILQRIDSKSDSFAFMHTIDSAFYNQNIDDLIDENELTTIHIYQINLGLSPEYLPHHWGFNNDNFIQLTSLNANDVFIPFDTVNTLSISSKISRLSTSESYINKISKPLKEYNNKQQIILKKAIEIQSITKDSLHNYIKNITLQRKNKWISKMAYDAFLTNAHETFSEYFRLKCTEAKLDIESSINLKLLLEQLSSDLSEKHWELVVSQLRKK